MKKYNSVNDMKNNSTRSSCSNGNESLIRPETILHNIKKLFGEYGSTQHCQPAEYAKRDIGPGYCHNKKKFDQYTSNDSTKCKDVSKKGTRIFESFHSALNENKCNLSSRYNNNLNNDYQVSDNKRNNHKLKACRYMSDEFCPFCQIAPHKHTMSKDNYEDYVREEKLRKNKQFHNLQDKSSHELTTCYLRIPKKYLIKNQGFSEKNISLSLDDDEEEYNIIIHKNSLSVGKQSFREVNRKKPTQNYTNKHMSDTNSRQLNKMNSWKEQNVVHNETLGNDSEFHLKQRNKNCGLNSKQRKKGYSEHFNDSISVSYSTVKINYQIAPLLLMASAVSRQILQAAIINYETFLLYRIFNKYPTVRLPQIPVTQDVSISCQLDIASISQDLTCQNKSLECPKSNSDYSESLSMLISKVSKSAKTVFDSGYKSIVPKKLYHEENSKIGSDNKDCEEQTIKVNDYNEICVENDKFLTVLPNDEICVENDKFLTVLPNDEICVVKDKFSTVFPQAQEMTKKIIDVGLNNYDNFFRLGTHSTNLYKEDLKNKIVHDASVSCNLASEMESEILNLNTELFKGMKQEFMDIFEISRKLKSSASEILGALNDFTKMPALPDEDQIENGLCSHMTSEESVAPVLSKTASSDKFYSKNIIPNTEIKFRSNNFFDKIPNSVPLPYDNLNMVFPAFINQLNETQDVYRTFNCQENERSINQIDDNYYKYEENTSEQEPEIRYNDIKNKLVNNVFKEAIYTQQLRGELNNRQKNRLRKWEYYCSKPPLQPRNCFSEGCISTSRSLPIQGSQPHQILWCLTRVTSYVNGSRTYEFIDKMQLATPNSIGDNTVEQETEIPNMVVVMSHYDDSNESLVNHASSSQNL